jgi:hypothetical protein
MDSTIVLSFKYSEQDFVRAMRAHLASRLRLKLDIAVVVAATAFGVYAWQALELPWYGLTLLGVCALFGIVLVLAFTALPRLIFRREAKFRDVYTLAFSRDDIHFRTDHIDSRLQWSMYDRALVDAHSFILYYGSSSFTVIPKRVFEDVQQRAAFETMISEKIQRVSEVHV